jgi:hypothetical protein
MSLPGCCDLTTPGCKLRVSLIKAAKNRSKNVTAPMHRIASAILITSPARTPLEYFQTHWNTLDVRAGTRIHKKFVRAAELFPML